jgi:hypothetical protein
MLEDIMSKIEEMIKDNFYSSPLGQLMSCNTMNDGGSEIVSTAEQSFLEFLWCAEIHFAMKGGTNLFDATITRSFFLNYF